MGEYMKTTKKKKNWTKPYHKHTRNLLYAVLAPYTKLRYNIEIVPFKEQGDRPYMIIMNHQTGLDQFFVAMTFKGAVYYVATEDLFSMGWISSVIRFLVEPIPIKKQTNDTQAVRNIIKVAREGGTIALAPEGNRTYSGRTEYIKPAIAGLVRVSKLPLAVFRIEGGYGVQPRWSDVVRKGCIRSYVSRVIEYEEYKKL
ncbi:MAG: 1-acyl-sn-glycerol-3-phosphate acyltransferase, partial [Clostridiales bacterium]|nr:1-acyl-sn-glycerol-3-phosphate acyltransferase [Clostridiales bacterium]